MLVQFVQDDDIVDYTPAADSLIGDVVVIGELVGVLCHDTKAGALGALAVEGVFDFPKATIAGSAIAGGAKTYWDAVNKKAVTVDGGGANKFIGKSILAAADADALVRIRLQQ
jgi:predicted RecA/RadA family phage recombinase